MPVELPSKCFVGSLQVMSPWLSNSCSNGCYILQCLSNSRPSACRIFPWCFSNSHPSTCQITVHTPVEFPPQCLLDSCPSACRVSINVSLPSIPFCSLTSSRCLVSGIQRFRNRICCWRPRKWTRCSCDLAPPYASVVHGKSMD